MQGAIHNLGIISRAGCPFRGRVALTWSPAARARGRRLLAAGPRGVALAGANDTPPRRVRAPVSCMAQLSCVDARVVRRAVSTRAMSADPHATLLLEGEATERDT
jgi:hypothetical protein